MPIHFDFYIENITISDINTDSGKVWFLGVRELRRGEAHMVVLHEYDAVSQMATIFDPTNAVSKIYQVTESTSGSTVLKMPESVRFVSSDTPPFELINAFSFTSHNMETDSQKQHELEIEIDKLQFVYEVLSQPYSLVAPVGHKDSIGGPEQGKIVFNQVLSVYDTAKDRILRTKDQVITDPKVEIFLYEVREWLARIDKLETVSHNWDWFVKQKLMPEPKNSPSVAPTPRSTVSAKAVFNRAPEPVRQDILKSINELELLKNKILSMGVENIEPLEYRTMAYTTLRTAMERYKNFCFDINANGLVPREIHNSVTELYNAISAVMQLIPETVDADGMFMDVARGDFTLIESARTQFEL